jgi:hypothetical protein
VRVCAARVRRQALADPAGRGGRFKFEAWTAVESWSQTRGSQGKEGYQQGGGAPHGIGDVRDLAKQPASLPSLTWPRGGTVREDVVRDLSQREDVDRKRALGETDA